MIEIKKAERFRCCNVCYSKENVKNITFRYDGTNSGTQITLCESCITELVNKVLSAQPEWKTGEWIKTTKHHADDKQEFDYYEITCSVCGSRPEKTWHLTTFCPNCGAFMKGEHNERHN